MELQNIAIDENVIWKATVSNHNRGDLDYGRKLSRLFEV